MRDEPNKNMIAVYDLLYLINKSRSESNDVMIAKKILDNRYDLNKYSLDKLSEKTYFSQASLSRFIKKWDIRIIVSLKIVLCFLIM